jgi:hypothetical protein
MDWQPWIALLVAGYGVYQQHKQTKMMEAHTIPRPGVSPRAIKSSWWKTPVIPILAVLVALAWWPDIAERLNQPTLQNPAKAGWGARTAITESGTSRLKELTLFVTLDGAYLNRYAENFSMIAVAVHYRGDRDLDDVAITEKSAVYGIHDEQELLLIKTSQTFIDEVNAGLRNTTYFVVLVPNGLTPENFTTFRQAKHLGAIVLPVGGGPP